MGNITKTLKLKQWLIISIIKIALIINPTSYKKIHTSSLALIINPNLKLLSILKRETKSRKRFNCRRLNTRNAKQVIQF